MSMQLRELAVEAKPKNRREVLALLPKKKYDDGLTKQSFKDETNINKILQRAQKGGTLSHLNQYEGIYADFSDYDFWEHRQKLAVGDQVFNKLPSELRKEFGNDPAKFFAFVNDPANQGKLAELLPDLAKPGKQMVDVSGKADPTPEAPPAPPNGAGEPQAPSVEAPRPQAE
ncbi:internal scaffolding protein [Microviridae sp.]|nr:internal scaffolding protein [Microviridae sp.]